jgi:transcriptional regulator with XRE-family HTH domain
MSAVHPIKAYRDRTGKTQQRVASMLSVAEMTVSRWERGEHMPRPRQLKLIKRKLGIDPAQIIKFALEAA